jgi:AcrR family transcriptional regulator
MTSTPKLNRGPSAGPGNRRALIAAAREVFTSDGYAAPLSAVARRAGVGQGSLYRHFPTRVALAVAVFDENISELENVARRPATSLDDLLERIIEQAVVSTALIDLVSGERADPWVQHLETRITAVVSQVVAREKDAGRIGQAVAVDDVLLAISMLAGLVARTPAGERNAIAHRAWSLLHRTFAP